jgi:hypothetical protein
MFIYNCCLHSSALVTLHPANACSVLKIPYVSQRHCSFRFFTLYLQTLQAAQIILGAENDKTGEMERI